MWIIVFLVLLVVIHYTRFAVRPSYISPTIPGGRAFITNNAMDYRELMIMRAVRNIDITSATICCGERFHRLLGLIEKRMNEKRDLTVRIIIRRMFTDGKSIQILRRLHEEYPNFYYLILVDRLSVYPFGLIENHIKITVIDNYFIIGSSNIGGDDTYIAHFKDADLIGTGENIIKEVETAFEVLWQLMGGRFISCGYKYIKTNIPNIPEIENLCITCDSMKLIVQFNPNESTITKELVHMIHRNKRIIIMTPAFSPSRMLLKALEGKKHTIISNSYNSLDRPDKYSYSLITVKNSLSTSNVLGYSFQEHNLHKKIWVFDNHCVIGSYNATFKSHTIDYECVIIVSGKEITQHILDNIYAEKKFCSQIDLKINRLQLIMATIMQFLTRFA